MAMSPRLDLRQSQSLVMTPQLQQAIKLLQMSNLELAEHLAAEVEKNPLLEFVPAPGGLSPGLAGPSPRGAGADGAFDLIEAAPSLGDHLRAQIGSSRAEPASAEAATLLADELDDDGYLRVPLGEVTLRHRLTLAEAEAGLALLQACDPPGVGARTLKECLALQLSERNRLDPAMRALIDNLDLLSTGKAGLLPGICGVDAADMADMLAELRDLDPKPGLRFSAVPVQVAVPDVTVRRSGAGTWVVEINSETLPRVLVNNIYAASVRGSDPTARQYISECSAAANWLVRSLEQRARTILRVATEIVRHQELFFALGVAKMRPLTQRMVADHLSLHESTVSRVTAGKFLACDQGIFELRFFFSAAIQSTGGGEGFSATAVQDRIRQLILGEGGKRTLSDDRLVNLLHGEGIDIARRTVAKYREALGIPSSVERRRRQAAERRS